MPSVSPAAARVGGVCLLLLLVVLGVLRSAVGTRLDSFTVDEPWHVVAGVVYARSGDFRLNPEHPPLVKHVVGRAMPATFVAPALVPLSEKEQERDFVQEALFLHNDGDAAQQRARLAMWLFHAALLLCCGLLLWRAFGLAWAAGSLLFLIIDPTVGAHLPVVMTDLPLALTLLTAALAGGLLAATWQWRWVPVCGIALGLALGAKHSALAGVAGIGLALTVAAVVSRNERVGRGVRLTQVASTALLAWLVLWALYAFRFHAALDGSDPFNRPFEDKLAEIGSVWMRDVVAFADRWHLAPRAYLWGLADTIRVGVDGRGLSVHRLFGGTFLGTTPWFAWPAILAGKVPEALLAASLAGAVALWRLRLEPAARWTLCVLVAVAAAHLVALLGSRGIWGGVRHALPLLVLLAIPAGALVASAWQQRSRALAAGCVVLFGGALAVTALEPRLWEYHNALAGGSRDGWQAFGNEGVDLGQRYHEIRDVYRRRIAPSGEPFYAAYWLLEQQADADGVIVRRRVESIDDDNVEGRYAGWVAYTMTDTESQPEFGWDAEAALRDMVLLERHGIVGIYRGHQTLPLVRARGLYDAVVRYVYEDKGSDWDKVARRLDEAMPWIPQHVGAAVELANARARLGDGRASAAALRGLLAQDKAPVDDRLRVQFEARVAELEAGADAAALPLLRNPWLE